MTYRQVLRKFRTQQGIAQVLGITQSTVSLWRGVVPDAYQYQLQVLTNGELRVDRRLLRVDRRLLRRIAA